METQYCSNCKHSVGFDENLLQCKKTKARLPSGKCKMKFCQHIRYEDTCDEYEEKTGYTTTIVVFVSFAALCAALYLAI